MQSNNKKQLDARTLPEIYKDLSETERQVLKCNIVTKIGVTEVCSWYWCTGKRKPATLLAKKKISQILNNVLNINTKLITLFNY